MKLIECVPNISEGRNKEIIAAVTDEIKKVPGAVLLDIDPGEATNRTVITFIGSLSAVEEAAFLVIKKASELIDMSKHKGEHPRMGATDVCPFIPMGASTMEDCVELAKKVGQRVGKELEIPVYLYENAATCPERQNLSDIRSGEYEGLGKKLEDPSWKPDFGPDKLNVQAGATAIGARQFLIAYNINLGTTDKALAHDIALDIREKGRLARDKSGTSLKDAQGNKKRQAGKFTHCKAVGWYIEEYNRAQISINLTDFTITPPHIVLEEVRKLALERGIIVTGSEIVGLVPLKAMLDAGKYYLIKQKKSPCAPDNMIIHNAVLSMGLEDVSPFCPKEKIIEYKTANSPLASSSIIDFCDNLSSDAPAPGGGSAAALAGALGACLCAMVCNLSHGRKEYAENMPELTPAGEECQELKKWFISAIDRDTQAFDMLFAAMKMPRKTDEQKKERSEAIEEKTKYAALVPFEILEKCLEIIKTALIVAEKGNKNSISDAGVSAAMAKSAAISAYYNVLTNIKGLKDQAWAKDINQKANATLARINSKSEEVHKIIMSAIS